MTTYRTKEITINGNKLVFHSLDGEHWWEVMPWAYWEKMIQECLLSKESMEEAFEAYVGEET